ncbi:MAG: putative Bug-like extracytoplasmic solute binding receptor, family [Ramlibacter sp.]|jgi:tripartite-type tricarboxylate transporter receptor subunit TctC|nr:putative Bug-like extracytoplasmic solute binding receptor, family [Ramlibacter sp.]
MRLLALLSFAAAVFTAVAPATAQDKFPSRPIQTIITTPAGSQGDVLIRALAIEASKTLGQPIIVLNRPNTTGTIGAELAKRAPPDGYTMFVGGNTTMAANVHLVKNLQYDPIKDFGAVTQLTGNPLVLVVKPALPVKTVQEFIAYAKSRPGQLNYGVGNSGSKAAVGLLQSLTGISTAEIPFPGMPPAVQELIAGRLDFLFSDPLVVDAHIKAGTLRALAVTASIKSPSMSSLPTMVEAGVPGYRDIVTFLGLWVPHGTPTPAISALNDAFVKAINSPEGQEQFRRMGLVPRPSTPEQLTTLNKEQIAFWEHLVKVSGLQPQ